jgi:HTH-type transcriptional regulator, competence development regulator
LVIDSPLIGTSQSHYHQRTLDMSSIDQARLLYQAQSPRILYVRTASILIVPNSKNQALTLGGYLAAVRSDRGYSLRQVEEMTGKEVSNAYLSQLENDKVKQPSPNVLHALAESYGIDYIGLMERAGYLTPQQSSEAPKRHGRAATFAEIDLTSDEEAELLRFLKFMRSEKK